MPEEGSTRSGRPQSGASVAARADAPATAGRADAAAPCGRPRGQGHELLLDLHRGAGPLRGQLEAGLRAAVRDRRLGVGARLPSSRTLAHDLGVSRRLVVEAYDQLVAEGFLAARRGSGTVVAEAAAVVPAGAPTGPPRSAAYDFFPGVGDLAGFPRADWLRATRAVLHDLPDAALGYPDARGVPALRTALAAHLARTRGVVGDPGRLVVCAGVTQALALLGRVLKAAGHEAVAVEDPSLPPHRAVLAAAGLAVVPVPVDRDGLRVDELRATGVGAVVVTPAHQFPLGMVLAPARRAALAAWARERRGLVIEDDYDAEFRFDRQPVGALQALAPAQVAYAGSASKALAPGLRLGWLVLPAGLTRPVAEAKALHDGGASVLDQHVLARLLTTAVYDRHLRLTRRRLAGRRAAVVAAVAEHLPDATVEGIAAGLHAVVRLPRTLDAGALLEAARRRDVGAWPLAAGPAERTDVLLLGYANLPEPALAEGVRRLAAAVAEAG